MGTYGCTHLVCFPSAKQRRIREIVKFRTCGDVVVDVPEAVNLEVIRRGRFGAFSCVKFTHETRSHVTWSTSTQAWRGD